MVHSSRAFGNGLGTESRRRAFCVLLSPAKERRVEIAFWIEYLYAFIFLGRKQILVSGYNKIHAAINSALQYFIIILVPANRLRYIR